jgi:hypothetical protein
MKSHFIPQFLLNAWAAKTRDNCLEVFRIDLPGLPSSRRRPRGTAFERNLYSLTKDKIRDMERDAIEKYFLQTIDNDAAQIRAKLLAGKIDLLTASESSAWALFISSLRLRQPNLVNDLKLQAELHIREQLHTFQSEFTTVQHESGIPSIEQWTENKFPGLIENFGLSFFAELVENKDVQQRLLSLNWWIWDGDRFGRELILSDNPCIFTAGIRESNLVIVLPISPTKAFVATGAASVAARFQSQAGRDLAMRINESSVNQARVRIYSTSRNVHRFIWNRLQQANRLPQARPAD